MKKPDDAMNTDDEVLEGEIIDEAEFLLDDSVLPTQEETLEKAVEKTELNQIALPYQIKDNKAITEKQKALRAVNLSKTMKEKFNNPETKWKKFLNPDIREQFLKYIRQTGSLTGALVKLRVNQKFDISQGTVNTLLMRFPTFKDMYEEAKEEYTYSLESEAHRRAVDGVDKGIYYQGEFVAYEKQYSDTLLAKLLDANSPKFRKASAGGQTNIKSSGPIQINIRKDFGE
jgi:hypothetical protein